MDAAWPLLRGKHRVLFHDVPAAIGIAKTCYPNDERAVVAALNHINLDEMCTADPWFKAGIELLAERDSRERSEGRKTKRALGLKSKPKKKRKGKGCGRLILKGIFAGS